MSISLLIWRLKAREKKMREHGFENTFGKEIWNLIIILILFSCSFLGRWMYDQWFADDLLTGGDSGTLCTDSETGSTVLCYPWSSCITILVTQYLWDFIPVAAILIFHHSNFSPQTNNTF